MPQKYKFSYTYANITAKMWHFSAKMPHFLGVGGGKIRYSYGMNRIIYRVSNVYLTYIYRVSIVVDSEMEAEEQVSFH